MSAEDSARSVRQAEGLDPVRALQRVLYRSAKQDRTRRFHALFDKLARSDVMWRAWVDVATNQGAPGVDGVTIADIEDGGVESVRAFLDELAATLRGGTYRPKPLRRVNIPKPGKAGQTRPLGIPTIADRVIMTAAKISGRGEDGPVGPVRGGGLRAHRGRRGSAGTPRSRWSPPMTQELHLARDDRGHFRVYDENFDPASQSEVLDGIRGACRSPRTATGGRRTATRTTGSTRPTHLHDRGEKSSHSPSAVRLGGVSPAHKRWLLRQYCRYPEYGALDTRRAVSGRS